MECSVVWLASKPHIHYPIIIIAFDYACTGKLLPSYINAVLLVFAPLLVNLVSKDSHHRVIMNISLGHSLGIPSLLVD